jgi:hypothetical protein
MEVEPGAVASIEKELKLQHGAYATYQPTGRADGLMRDVWYKITGSFTTASPTKSGPGHVLPVHQVGQPSQSAAPGNSCQQQSQRQTDSGSNLHLLLCVDEGSARPLHQKELNRVATDRELFTMLQGRYAQKTQMARWFTLRSISSLSLSRVCITYALFIYGI